MRIALILNTRRAESEFEVEYDPPHTVELIKHGILATGHKYIFIEADENFVENLKELKPDLVLNRAEGLRGDSRESHVPAILEMLGIPYVGSNVLTTAICLNKAWAKKVLLYHGISTPKFYVCKSDQEAERIRGGFPYILKPNEEGSSMGITEENVVHRKTQLRIKLKQMIEEYQQPILIEKFIQGREFSTGLLGRPGQDPEVLSILEIEFSKFPEVGGVFGQRAKTVLDSLDHYICPAQIPKNLKRLLERLSIDVWYALDVKDFARIDFRMNDKREFFFLEINPLPGMDFDTEENDLSFYPYMAMKSGYTYDELIRRLLESACARYGLKL
ncbi:MAG: ATP-grasp domain-containing protein [Candidatus Bathyarchaeota archaeon]|nr:ATP-grasp domain-containing protein [Candidatus Bathyarchaeota archaeon]MDH5663308.1 ATP-grasp domain-containing protein [Candidatus Bathyarchaeota archaeon]